MAKPLLSIKTLSVHRTKMDWYPDWWVHILSMAMFFLIQKISHKYQSAILIQQKLETVFYMGIFSGPTPANIIYWSFPAARTENKLFVCVTVCLLKMLISQHLGQEKNFSIMLSFLSALHLSFKFTVCCYFLFIISAWYARLAKVTHIVLPSLSLMKRLLQDFFSHESFPAKLEVGAPKQLTITKRKSGGKECSRLCLYQPPIQSANWINHIVCLLNHPPHPPCFTKQHINNMKTCILEDLEPPFPSVFSFFPVY